MWNWDADAKIITDGNLYESMLTKNQTAQCPSHFQPGEGPGDCEILANLRFQL